MVVIIIIGATWVLPQAPSPPHSSLALCSSQTQPPDVPDVSLCLGSGTSLSSLYVQILPFPQDPLHILLLLWKLLLIPPAGWNLSLLWTSVVCCLHIVYVMCLIWQPFCVKVLSSLLVCRLLEDQDCILWMPPFHMLLIAQWLPHSMLNALHIFQVAQSSSLLCMDCNF